MNIFVQKLNPKLYNVHKVYVSYVAIEVLCKNLYA